MRVIDFPNELVLSDGTRVNNSRELAELIVEGSAVSREVLELLYNGHLASWLKRTGCNAMADKAEQLRVSGSEPDELLRQLRRVLHVLTIEADGESLEKAILKAQPGDTLLLVSGVYRLSVPLEIRKSLSLGGQGEVETRIVGSGKGSVLILEGDCRWKISDIGLEHEGDAQADVVVVTDGEIMMQRCSCVGGIGDKEYTTGTGLSMKGRSRGTIAKCEFFRNGASGIRITDEAQITLEDNICKDNRQAGIEYLFRSGGVSRNNQCSSNGNMGIRVAGEADPLLEGNICQENRGVGIMYAGVASGTALDNQCIRNGNSGIRMTEKARPTLEGNICRYNRGAGIAYIAGTFGTARNNQCIGNENAGIQVAGEAKPVLESNICRDNRETGIGYFATSGGIARHNQCIGNEGFGIQVLSEADLLLEKNICRDNKEMGILAGRTTIVNGGNGLGRS